MSLNFCFSKISNEQKPNIPYPKIVLILIQQTRIINELVLVDCKPFYAEIQQMSRGPKKKLNSIKEKCSISVFSVENLEFACNIWYIYRNRFSHRYYCLLNKIPNRQLDENDLLCYNWFGCVSFLRTCVLKIRKLIGHSMELLLKFHTYTKMCIAYLLPFNLNSQ